MADLYASVEHDVPRDGTLRLSIEWRELKWVSDFSDEAYGEMQIGLFIGDRPLFTDYIYSGGRGHYGLKFPPGFFFGEDARCSIFDHLDRTLATGSRMQFESYYDPHFMLHIGPDIYSSEEKPAWEPDTYEVLTIIQHGGPWHGPAMGGNGPAAYFYVDRDPLIAFRQTLFDEAIGLVGADPRAVEVLKATYASR